MNQELRQAAERAAKHWRVHRHNYKADRPFQITAGTLADFAAKLFDPTPLTPELLKRVGFEVVRAFDGGHGEVLRLGELDCVWETKRKGMWIGWSQMQERFWPRTLGELRQLAMRLEVELKEPQS